uniref:Band 7 protein n=1 Tax=Macrostomum lignano TaxID=282301 RepID=A0A1I8GQ58_9PLAT
MNELTVNEFQVDSERRAQEAPTRSGLMIQSKLAPVAPTDSRVATTKALRLKIETLEAAEPAGLASLPPPAQAPNTETEAAVAPTAGSAAAPETRVPPTAALAVAEAEARPP